MMTLLILLINTTKFCCQRNDDCMSVHTCRISETLGIGGGFSVILSISGLTWCISFYHHYDKMSVYAMEKNLNLAHSFSRLSLWSLGSIFLGLWEA